VLCRCKTAIVELAPELLARLARHDWPGNLRQYANALRTASAMLDPHENHITWLHLPDDLQEDLQMALATNARPATAPAWGAMPPAQNAQIKYTRDAAVASQGTGDGGHNLQALSRQTIRQAVDASCGNLSQVARRLGISRQTLYRKLND
jgi:DNA-binding NtrC family response regulator